MTERAEAVEDGGGRADRLRRVSERVHGRARTARLDDCLHDVLRLAASDHRFGVAVALVESDDGTLAFASTGTDAAPRDLSAVTARAHAVHTWLAAPAKARPVRRVTRNGRPLQYVVMPTAGRHQVILGSLHLEATTPVDERDIAYATAVAVQLALAIEASRLGAALSASYAELAAERRERIAAELALGDFRAAAWSAEWLRHRFQALLDALPGAFAWEADAEELALSYVGRGVKELTGATAQQLLSTRASFLGLLDPASVATVRDVCHRALATGAVRSCRHLVRTTVGTLRTTLTSVGPAPGAPGKVLGISVAADDGVALPPRSHTSADVSSQTRVDPRRSDERAHALVEVVSHELRDPLNTLATGVALLLRQEGEPGESSGRGRVLEAMVRSAGRMDRLLQDILDAARIGASGLVVRRVRVRVSALLAEAAAHPPALLAHKALRLRVDPILDDPYVLCDPDRAGQVFSNLLGNATKYTRTGGTITLEARLAAGEVVFSVCDTGCGISDALLPHVFDRYARSEAATGGVGLGLYICKAIVDAHGGRIWARSKPGSGTTFSFSIPVFEG